MAVLKTELSMTEQVIGLVRIIAEMQHTHRLTTLALLRSLADDKDGMKNDIEEAVANLHRSADAISLFNANLDKKVAEIGAAVDRIIGDATQQ